MNGVNSQSPRQTKLQSAAIIGMLYFFFSFAENCEISSSSSRTKRKVCRGQALQEITQRGKNNMRRVCSLLTKSHHASTRRETLICLEIAALESCF